MPAHSFLSSLQGDVFCAAAVDAYSMNEAQITRAIFIIELSRFCRQLPPWHQFALPQKGES
jgi:hypothetical protein